MWGVDRKIRASWSQSGIIGKPRDARRWSSGQIFYLPLTKMIDPYIIQRVINVDVTSHDVASALVRRCMKDMCPVGYSLTIGGNYWSSVEKKLS